jgi:hypothetical protein
MRRRSAGRRTALAGTKKIPRQQNDAVRLQASVEADALRTQNGQLPEGVMVGAIALVGGGVPSVIVLALLFAVSAILAGYCCRHLKTASGRKVGERSFNVERARAI